MSNSINPIVSTKKGQVLCNSRDVAELFGKRHDNVLRDLTRLETELLGSSDLRNLFTERVDYHSTARKMVRSFDMTKDGFTLLAMASQACKFQD